MKKSPIAGIYVMGIAWGALFILGIALVTTKVLKQVQTGARQSPKSAQVQSSTTCTPQSVGALAVGGLFRDDVPRLPDAFRLSYADNGTSRYATPLDTQDVFGYYLPSLAANCWELAAMTPTESVWVKNGETVKIAVRQNPLGGRALVDYESYGTNVLGISYRIAQDAGSLPPPPSGSTTPPPPPPPSDATPPPPSGSTTPPPPPSGSTYQQYPSSGQYPTTGQYPQAGTTQYPNQYPAPTNQYPTGQYPSSGQYPTSGQYPSQPGTTQYPTTGQQYPQPTNAQSCPTGQYFCNDKCVQQGSSCNGFQYYKPGDTSQQPYPGQTSGPSQFGQQQFGQQPQTGQQQFGSQQQAPNPQGSPSGSNQFPGKGEFRGAPGEFPGGSQGSQFGSGQSGQGEDQEVMMQKMDEQRLTMMRKGLSQFSQGATQMQKMVARMEPRLAKLGVGIPEELKAALAKAPEIIERVKSAQSADELDAVVEDIHDVGDSMQEWGPKFGDLMRLGEMLKQTDRDNKTIQRDIKKLTASAKRNPAIQEQVNALTSLAGGLTQAVTAARELAKTDADGALEKLETDYIDKQEEIRGLMAEIDTVLNVSRGITQAKREITKSERAIQALARGKKVDAGTIQELKDSIATIKGKVSDLQTLSKQKGSAEEIVATAEEAWGTMTEVQNKLAGLGQGFYESTAKRGENVNITIPDAFNFGATGEQPAVQAPSF